MNKIILRTSALALQESIEFTVIESIQNRLLKFNCRTFLDQVEIDSPIIRRKRCKMWTKRKQYYILFNDEQLHMTYFLQGERENSLTKPTQRTYKLIKFYPK